MLHWWAWAASGGFCSVQCDQPLGSLWIHLSAWHLAHFASKLNRAADTLQCPGGCCTAWVPQISSWAMMMGVALPVGSTTYAPWLSPPKHSNFHRKHLYLPGTNAAIWWRRYIQMMRTKPSLAELPKL
jgi:hypothetical protein